MKPFVVLINGPVGIGKTVLVDRVRHALKNVVSVKVHNFMADAPYPAAKREADKIHSEIDRYKHGQLVIIENHPLVQKALGHEHAKPRFKGEHVDMAIHIIAKPTVLARLTGRHVRDCIAEISSFEMLTAEHCGVPGIHVLRIEHENGRLVAAGDVTQLIVSEYNKHMAQQGKYAA